MSLFGDWNASLDQLKDRVGEWVTQGSGMLTSMGAGPKNRERGARSWDDSQENEAGASREDFASRVQEVHMHLNLSVRPILISGGANFSIAKEILREAYADEPVFKWLLGNVNPKKDLASYQRRFPTSEGHGFANRISMNFPVSPPIRIHGSTDAWRGKLTNELVVC